MSDSNILITVRDIQDGEQWTFGGGSACPTLEKGLTGDGGIRWAYDFQAFSDRLFPRHAHVEVSDEIGVIQTGRISRRQPPGTDVCDGQCQAYAEGYAASGSDRKFSTSTILGPVWSGFSFIGLTPESGVTHATTQLGNSNISPVSIATSGITLSDTENFAGRTWQDVATQMAAYGSSATPFVWSVKKGNFRWGPLDLAARYQASIADGLVITPTDDSSRLYNRVIVLWGQDQAQTWPETVTYAQIPTIVDLVVHAGAEIKTPAAALQLAQALHARLDQLEFGWSWNFTIPGTCLIEELGHGPTTLPRMEAGSVLRVPDLDPVGRWGAKHPCPEQLLVTSLTWNGERNELSGTCGEIRDPSHFMRQVAFGQTSSILLPFQAKPGEMRRIRDAGKIATFGPFIATSTATSTNAVTPGPTTSPSRIDYRTPAIDTKHETVHPRDLPPMPPPILFHDGDPMTTGVKTKLIVPPIRALKWTLAAPGPTNYKATFTRRSNGATVANMDAAGSSERLDVAIGSTTVNSTIGLVEKDDLLIYTVTDAASSTSITFVTAGIRTVRYFPDYVGNQAPITGSTATAT